MSQSQSSKGQLELNQVFYDAKKNNEEEQESYDNLQQPNKVYHDLESIHPLIEKPNTPTLRTRSKKIAIILLLLALAGILFIFRPKPQIPSYTSYYPDLTTVKGNTKEAYAFFFCTRQSASHDLQMMYEGLKVTIYRLKQLQGYKRDIIVAACQFISPEQMNEIRKLDVIVVPVQTINPPNRPYVFAKWIDTFTKLAFFRLINWERLLFMDIDIFWRDNFLELWDDPATKIVEKPPAGVDPESTYLGSKVKDLYPHLFAATYDTWHTKWSIEKKTLNSGVFITKPSVAHYNLLMHVAYNDSTYFNEMEQAEMTYVYDYFKSPVPWAPFDLNYNYAITEDGNYINDKVRGYHFKVWDEHPADKWAPLTMQWRVYRDEMKSKFNQVVIQSSHCTQNISLTSVTLEGVKLSNGTGTYYAIASTNITHMPTAHQIKMGLDASENVCPSGKSDKPNEFTIDGLASDTVYMIYYFADIDNGFPKFTDVNYIKVQTKSEKKGFFQF